MEKHFLTNYSKVTFLNQLKDYLGKCSAFYFSVSFIKRAGLILILNDIKSALQRGAKGMLITSTYQNFTDVSSLNEFLKLMNDFDNFKCNIDFNCFDNIGYHSKGYLFEFDNRFGILIGSSNITRYALLKNIEWNIGVKGELNDNYFSLVLDEFNYLWQNTISLSEEVIKRYSLQVEYAIERWDMDFVDFTQSRIKPNYMQKKALKEISRYRALGVERALIIAATGSGKTYLAAFDALNENPNKLLFVVHRENILREAMKSFRNIFGTRKTYGLYVGEIKEIDRDFIFTTNLTMANNLDSFSKKEFDYIIIDEVHHAAATTYQKIINYFKPSFLLGLTATPERMDDPKAIFELFEKNVPYELRLRDALENELIVPFKYYGIKDTFVDYSENNIRKLIKQIADETHCQFIQENIEKYRKNINGKLKAIGFCRNIEHSKIMAKQMEELGYNTISLTGENSVNERNQIFKSLQDETNPLEIIFTVDILNEGVDIPAINMVIFLRPTESSTIFIQQLGRGLRLYDNKEYLTVLDFIGNSYSRSVQIAMALGTLSEKFHVDKRMLANFVREDFKQLDLPIEIYMDEESKEEILNAIETTNFNSLLFLRQDYQNFKKYLKSDVYLKHLDYLHSDVTLDLLRYIKRMGSYYEFLLKVEDDLPIFSDNQRKFLRYISTYLPLIRPYEYLILKELINEPHNYNDLVTKLKSTDNFNKDKFDHALNNLQNKYYSQKEQKNMTKYVNIDSNKLYKIINVDIDEEFINHLDDLLDYGLMKFEEDFYGIKEDLKLYYTYTRSSLLQALCNHTFASREGLIWHDNNLYIFIDLKKDQTKDEWLLYDDRFLSSKILQWETWTNSTLNNKRGLRILNKEYVHVFVRKMQREDGLTMPYIYLGKGELTKPRESTNIRKTLLFDVILENEVPDYLKYDFEIEVEEN